MTRISKVERVAFATRRALQGARLVVFDPDTPEEDSQMQINPVMPTGSDGLRSLPGERAKVQPDQEAQIKSTQEIERAMSEIAQVIEPFNIALKFSKDDETGRIVIQMIDQQSGDTVQQIPNEATLRVAAVLSKLQGKIVNCKA